MAKLITVGETLAPNHAKQFSSKTEDCQNYENPPNIQK